MDRSLVALGAAPLAAGALVPVDAVMDGPLLCPFQAVTGAPCPFCGATRAFALFGHADARWLDYGAVWIVVALVVVAIGVAGRRIAWRAVVAAAATAWAWALAQAATIT
ncbi:MAG: DUF2752 domain-containing protein [Solirubrobacteraceae bacterium]